MRILGKIGTDSFPGEHHSDVGFFLLEKASCTSQDSIRTRILKVLGAVGHMAAGKISTSARRRRAGGRPSVMADPLACDRLHYQWHHSLLSRTVVHEVTAGIIMSLNCMSRINTATLLLFGYIATREGVFLHSP